MADYTLRFAASAAKEFRLLPLDTKSRIAVAIEELRGNPGPFGVRKLKGHDRLYRVRVGQYRVVYEIDDQAQLLWITEVRHRRDAYR